MCLGRICQLGFVTELLSKPIRYGYVNGIVFTVLVGQLPTMLGFSVSGQDIPRRVIGIVNGVFQGQLNWLAFAISFLCLIVIYGIRWWKPMVPGVLIAIICSTIAVSILGLARQGGVSVVGTLPQGFLAFECPRFPSLKCERCFPVLSP